LENISNPDSNSCSFSSHKSSPSPILNISVDHAGLFLFDLAISRRGLDLSNLHGENLNCLHFNLGMD
jgi:hypothetical protein